MYNLIRSPSFFKFVRYCKECIMSEFVTITKLRHERHLRFIIVTSNEFSIFLANTQLPYRILFYHHPKILFIFLRFSTHPLAVVLMMLTVQWLVCNICNCYSLIYIFKTDIATTNDDAISIMMFYLLV